MNRKGFTLIELLVVIAIIGILASVILASLNSARGKARDAVRLSALKEMQTALELYYDTHGQYPDVNTTCPYRNWSYSSVCEDYIPGLLTDNLMSKLPQPPSGTFLYTTRPGDNFQSYKLSVDRVEHETVLPTSQWSHCPADCVTTEPNSWCAGRQSDYGAYYSVSVGFARCNY